jgi:hypothetical protein
MKNILILMLIFCCITGEAVLADPPLNDDCWNADDAGTLLSGLPVQLSGTSVDATQDCMMDYPMPEVWVKFTITDCMSITIDYCDDPLSHADYANMLYTECPCDNSSIYASNQENCTNNGRLFTWNYLEAGTYYYPILADNFIGAAYTINITGEDCPETPTNDNCADAIAISEVTDYEFHTVGATFDGDGMCNEAPNVWFIYTASFTGDAVISLCGSDYNTKLAVYDGVSCDPLPTELGCNDNYSYCGNASQLILPVVTGNQYLVEIGGGYDAVGSGLLTIEEYQTPLNDDCSNATDAGTLIAGATVPITGDNTLATQDCEELDNPEVWIKFTLADSMDVTIDYCGMTPVWNFIAINRKLFMDCPCGSYLTANNFQQCEDGNLSLNWSCLAAGDYYYPVILTSSGRGQYIVNILGQPCAAPEPGACCFMEGPMQMCQITESEALCENEYSGTFHLGATCEDVDPPDGIADVCGNGSSEGACCYEEGPMMLCITVEDEIACVEQFSGTFHQGATCEDVDPPDGIADVCGNGSLEGACCYQQDDVIMCFVTDDQSSCDALNGTFHSGAACEDGDENGVADICESGSQSGACCIGENPDTQCMIVSSQDECELGRMGTFYLGATCDDGDGNEIADICEQVPGYEYLPGDANMINGQWPPKVIGADVTYLVGYFRVINGPCLGGGFFNAGDANGDCNIIGSDVTRLVSYFRGISDIAHCADYPPAWLVPDDCPSEAPAGWPNCEAVPEEE